ncbi:MAG: T9SS type A sorting domain-containing protein, partial [Candidatus Cloacimonetes bacterium]|nr:T9SS type A sorting domain-containing protein [Candidatus Cloacimonadota bacterium]
RTVDNKEIQVTEINPHTFEFNGSLLLTSEACIPADSRILAYCKNELRGVSELLDYREILGRKYYALMLYSNQETEEDFQLYYQSSAESELIKLEYGFTFESDMRTGDFVNPLFIALPDTESEEIISTEQMTIFPNPFNPETTINYEISDDEYICIEIYNLKGQKIDTLVNAVQESGKHTATWNAVSQPSGIYFLNFKTSSTQRISKLILLK